MLDALFFRITMRRMIHPTSKFVLLQWVAKDNNSAIVLPDSSMPTGGGDFIVLALGPEVPKDPPISAGSKVLLRGDAPPISGVDARNKIGMMHYDWVMAVVDDEIALPTDDQIRQMAGN